MKRDDATDLYRAYDADGQLLYIGIAYSWTKRWNQHCDRSPWFDQVARVDVERFPTRKEAERAEADAVRLEKPLHNVRLQAREQEPANRPSLRVENFDHCKWVHLDEYHSAVAAIDELANAVGRHQIETTLSGFLQLLIDTARTVAYGDCCRRCGLDAICYPIKVHVEGIGLKGWYYHAACGSHWICSWAVDAPLMCP